MTFDNEDEIFPIRKCNKCQSYTIISLIFVIIILSSWLIIANPPSSSNDYTFPPPITGLWPTPGPTVPETCPVCPNCPSGQDCECKIEPDSKELECNCVELPSSNPEDFCVELIWKPWDSLTQCQTDVQCSMGTAVCCEFNIFTTGTLALSACTTHGAIDTCNCLKFDNEKVTSTVSQSTTDEIVQNTTECPNGMCIGIDPFDNWLDEAKCLSNYINCPDGSIRSICCPVCLNNTWTQYCKANDSLIHCDVTCQFHDMPQNFTTTTTTATTTVPTTTLVEFPTQPPRCPNCYLENTYATVELCEGSSITCDIGSIPQCCATNNSWVRFCCPDDQPCGLCAVETPIPPSTPSTSPKPTGACLSCEVYPIRLQSSNDCEDVYVRLGGKLNMASCCEYNNTHGHYWIYRNCTQPINNIGYCCNTDPDDYPPIEEPTSTPPPSINCTAKQPYFNNVTNTYMHWQTYNECFNYWNYNLPYGYNYTCCQNAPNPVDSSLSWWYLYQYPNGQPRCNCSQVYGNEQPCPESMLMYNAEYNGGQLDCVNQGNAVCAAAGYPNFECFSGPSAWQGKNSTTGYCLKGATTAQCLNYLTNLMPCPSDAQWQDNSGTWRGYQPDCSYCNLNAICNSCGDYTVCSYNIYYGIDLCQVCKFPPKDNRPCPSTCTSHSYCKGALIDSNCQYEVHNFCPGSNPNARQYCCGNQVISTEQYIICCDGETANACQRCGGPSTACFWIDYIKDLLYLN